MIEGAYLGVRAVRFFLTIIVFSAIINGYLDQKKGQFWELARKVSTPLLIFSGASIFNDTITIVHFMQSGTVNDFIAPLWARTIVVSLHCYGWYSCIDAFFTGTIKKYWKVAFACILTIGLAVLGYWEIFR